MRVKKFNHVDIEWSHIPELTMLDKPGHWYESEEDGLTYPSITTMLNAIDQKLWYYRWLTSLQKKHGLMTHTAAKKMAEKIQNSSLEIGTRMHKYAENYLLNKRVQITHARDRYEESPWELFKGVRKYLNEHVDNVYGVEKKMFSRKLGLAGTADFIAEVDGVLSIGDFKNFRREKFYSRCKNYFIQGCAYAEMFREMTGIEINQVVIIGAVWGTYNLQTFEVNPRDFRKELDECLDKFHSKIGKI